METVKYNIFHTLRERLYFVEPEDYKLTCFHDKNK